MARFHAGELAVQARAGAQEMARRVSNGMRPSMPPVVQEFLLGQPMLVVASVDAAGRRWASLLAGPPGFARALDDRTLQVTARPAPGDPLADNLRSGARVGIIAIEFATRRRMRLNGVVEMSSGGAVDLSSGEVGEAGDASGSALTFRVRAEQVYGNCQKYIQAREWTALPDNERSPERVTGASISARSSALTDDQRRGIERADTFFIATAHAENGADASHRGGLPGFVRVEDDRHLIFPDYSGNMMFNTLGNIVADPRAGLVFVDFERRSTLQITGRAEVIWDPEQTAKLAGAERVVAFAIDEVIESVNDALPSSHLVEYSPFNPS
jgi:predicted pyridoxine 5'-phosphate oxidase superfamily flavin-nucleotide-binding protein